MVLGLDVVLIISVPEFSFYPYFVFSLFVVIVMRFFDLGNCMMFLFYKAP